MQIAVEKFSEATVGYRENREIAEKWVQLFNTSYFMVSVVSAKNLSSLVDMHSSRIKNNLQTIINSIS